MKPLFSLLFQPIKWSLASLIALFSWTFVPKPHLFMGCFLSVEQENIANIGATYQCLKCFRIGFLHGLLLVWICLLHSCSKRWQPNPCLFACCVRWKQNLVPWIAFALSGTAYSGLLPSLRDSKSSKRLFAISAISCPHLDSWDRGRSVDLFDLIRLAVDVVLNDIPRLGIFSSGQQHQRYNILVV